jgi:hypothetical protein
VSARTFLVFAGLLALPLLGQPTPNPPAASRPAADSSASARPAAQAGSNPAAQDSLSVPKSRADTVLVVKHRFNHREQIITGSVVMTCLALMMVVMNNYNPR